MKHNRKSAGLRFWVLLWTLGIIGQLCWNVENQWFNTFVYAKIAKDPTIISWMVAISSVATTIATFVAGTLSDRMGKRKPFVAGGYILWGIFTVLFGTTQYIGGSSKTAGTLLLAATAVVVADALMSFFGSSGNDAGYNAWLNDCMTEQNKGHIGAALATQPILGTIVGTVAGGILIGSSDNYMRLFVVMGGAVILLGLLCFFFMEEAPDLKPNKEGSFLHQLAGAFDLKGLLARKELVWVFLTLMVYFISFDVYFPHVGNYLIYYLGFSADMIGILEGIALLLGMVIVIPSSRLVSMNRFPLAASISVVLTFAGILVIGITGTPEGVDPSTLLNWNLLIGLFFFGCGYIMFMQVLAVWMKQLFPADAKGQFEGFRIVFFVLLPWIISPFISNPIIKQNGQFVNADGFIDYLPTNTLFLISAALILLTFVPMFFAAKYRKNS